MTKCFARLALSIDLLLNIRLSFTQMGSANFIIALYISLTITICLLAPRISYLSNFSSASPLSRLPLPFCQSHHFLLLLICLYYHSLFTFIFPAIPATHTLHLICIPLLILLCIVTPHIYLKIFISANFFIFLFSSSYSSSSSTPKIPICTS